MIVITLVIRNLILAKPVLAIDSNVSEKPSNWYLSKEFTTAMMLPIVPLIPQISHQPFNVE